ncbi:MAG: TVP38/TMEM64 family protein [Oscillospiraceae bacterium]|nr:TVP38/TMEM64 family protein [Oscillospiraceae bacterium]
MRKRVAEILMTIAKILPFVVMLALVALYLPNKDAVSVDSILRYTPDNLWLAALALLAAYAVKSLSVFFPLLVLYAAAGLLFPLPAALLVNLSGLLVCVTVPYGIGRFAGKDLVDSLQKKYKKIARINEIKRGSEFFFAFFLRIIEFLPGDVVSMVLGASGMTYWKFAVGSLLGLLPVMVATTVAGSSLSDPTSPVFIVTAVLVVLLSVGSFVLWRVVSRKNAGSRPETRS